MSTSHNRKIAVIGLGYVGLPVAVALGKLSHVVAFDVDVERIAELKTGTDHTGELVDAEFVGCDVLYTHNMCDMAACDFFIIAVPTPINNAKTPDLRTLYKASETVGNVLKPGDIVVYESTVYPGTTEDECLPILEKVSGLTSRVDFTVGFSPERINPGDKKHTFTKILKVVSGQDEQTCNTIAEVYGSVVEAGIYQAPSIRVAEAAKIIENTQRDVNIALINELAMIFDRMQIDTSEVLKAAGTKWNFLPFHPGLVGGHCIGVDPYYLSYKSTQLGYPPRLILEARRINDEMGIFIADRAIREAVIEGKNLQNAFATVLGFTFKENVPDIRNSRVVDIVTRFEQFGLKVQIHDPLGSAEEAEHEFGLSLTPFEELKPAAILVLAVAHNEYREMQPESIEKLVQSGGVIVDVRGILDAAAFQRRGLHVISL